MIATLGVYVWGYLGLFANYFFSKITKPFPQKSTELWTTIFLFDLNYIFINGSFAFSPG